MFFQMPVPFSGGKAGKNQVLSFFYCKNVLITMGKVWAKELGRKCFINTQTS